MAKNKRKFGKNRMENSGTSAGKVGGSLLDFSKVDGDIKPKFRKFEEDKNEIDFIPWEVKTKNHPMIRNGSLDIGDLDFMLELWTHFYEGKTVVCPKENYGKKCPLCEKQNEVFQEYRESDGVDTAKKMAGPFRAKQRALFTYRLPNSKNPNELFYTDVSYYLFAEGLMKKAQRKDTAFYDPEDGHTVTFYGEEASQGEAKWLKFDDFEFAKRDEEIEQELIDQAVPFDQLITLKSYDELEKLLHGEDDDEDDETPSKSEEPKKEKSEKKEEKSEEEHEDFNDYADRKKEEAEKPKKETKGGSKECPEGGKFGKDYSEFGDKCDNCPFEDECLNA